MEEGRKDNFLDSCMNVQDTLLYYHFGVSVAFLKMYIESWNMSTEKALLRRVSRLNFWSKRGVIDSENTYEAGA